MKEYKVIFWDFDGVIKDSVTAKSDAFEQLFLPFGKQLAEQVRLHHEANGGVSRFEKIPLYLEWARKSSDPAQVREFCDRFSQLTLSAVIDSPWIPGVREYLQDNHINQTFVLVTATPQEEIEQIVMSLSIAHFFDKIYGAPMPKSIAIRDALLRMQCLPAHALVVGDSETDFNAAKTNGVDFLLRRTPLNLSLQNQYCGPSFDCLDIS